MQKLPRQLTLSFQTLLLASCALAALSATARAQQPVATVLPSLDVDAAKPASARPPQATNASNAQPSQLVISPTGVATPSENVASAVTVITAKDLERDQRRTVADALRTVPGLNIVQTGAVGGQTSVFMRGTNSNHVKVLIDGIDVSDPSVPNGAFDFGHLMSADIERIEVLRGPQSGLYGANSIGGVISIITKKGEGPPRATAYLEGGSFGTFNQAAGLSGSKGIFSYAFNVGHVRSTDTPVTPSELLAPGQRRLNDYYDNWTYSTKLGADFSRFFSLNFVGRYTDATKLYTGDDFSVPPFTGAIANERSSLGVQQAYGRVEAVSTLMGGALKNYFSVARTSLHSVNVTPGVFGSTSVNDGDRVKIDWRNVVTVAPGQTIMLGLERKVEAISTTGFSALRAGEWNNAGYIEFQSQIGRNLFLALNGRYDDNETFGGHATYRFAPAFIVPGTDTKLKASVGTGFRAPSLNERFFQSGFFNGNPNLRPEESVGWDAGFEQPLLDNKVRFGVTHFHNDIKNLINSPAPFVTYENVAMASTQGIESFVSMAVTRDLNVRADYTFTRAFNETTGEELLRRPRHKASATADWTPTQALTLSGTVLYTGTWMDNDRFFSSPTSFQTSPYTLVNLAGSYKWSETTTLFARVDNLFDVRYQDPTGFQRPGLGVFAGVRLASW